MSATGQQTRNSASPPPAPRADDGGLAAASVAESLAVVFTGVVPALVRGLFSPRRAAMKLLTGLDTDGRAVTLLSKLRRKYNGEGLRLLGGKMVVVWGTGAIHEVLDRSAELYASDGGAKAKGMAHFQPDALTLSRGEEWRDRRDFNEAVLASSERLHPSAQRFLRVVAEEIDWLTLGTKLEWRHWEQLFDHITLRVIFGDQARTDQRLTATLEKLMGQANRLVGLGTSDDYYELYAGLERWLREPGPDSLIARFGEAPHSDRTRIVQQIPHWIFAMRDTLAANAFRALAAVVAQPEVERRVRDELGGADFTDPAAIDGMRYLEGCLQEAMRLWPTTPLLARESTRETTLAGTQLDEGTQVILLNVFNHRDADHVEEADRFVPERWASDERDYRFNHLSNGTQDCPGGPLVMLLGKAAIGGILQRYSLELEEPQLGGGGPLPYMLDFFDARFDVESRNERR